MNHYTRERTAASDFITTDLLLKTETHEGLDLLVSLYHFGYKNHTFYAIVSEELPEGKACAMEIIGSDLHLAEHFYERVVKGAVPPSTLSEIVCDALL